jgi:hypothetical protein
MFEPATRRRPTLGWRRLICTALVLGLALLLGACEGRPVASDSVALGDGHGQDGKYTQDGTALCGDSSLTSRFASCMATKTKADCENAGGTWETVGLGPETCVCRTGQGSCTCSRAKDCLGSCLGPGSSTKDCDTLTSGTCTSTSPTVGCHCWFFDDTGKATGICAD